MKILQIIMVSIVAIEHIYFLILEMFLWTTSKGIKAFGLKNKAFAVETKVLAANQGLYNGFLAAGLIYSLILRDSNTLIFFLICITIAGIYGAYSTRKLKLFYLQSVPAIFSLILIFITINKVT